MSRRCWDFLIDRANPSRGRRVDHFGGPPAIDEGDILVALKLMALSANSATYVTLGEQLGYWGFFPADDGWGRFPAWGIGEVIATRHCGFAAGDRIFGMLPPSTHVVMRPAAVQPTHFLDGAVHRRTLHPAYNHYTRLNDDASPGTLPDEWLALLRPLFLASFLLHEHLAENGWFGAEQFLLTSASSKTALGLAQLHKAHGGGPELLGVTSTRNLDFVRGTGMFAQVLDYRDLATAELKTVSVVDFAGDSELKRKLELASANGLRRWTSVGATHDATLPAGTDLDAFVDRLFFAPDHLRSRMASEGADEFERRLSSTLSRFHEEAHHWLNLREWRGPDQFEDLYARVIRGDLPPHEGQIFYP